MCSNAQDFIQMPSKQSRQLHEVHDQPCAIPQRPRLRRCWLFTIHTPNLGVRKHRFESNRDTADVNSGCPDMASFPTTLLGSEDRHNYRVALRTFRSTKPTYTNIRFSRSDILGYRVGVLALPLTFRLHSLGAFQSFVPALRMGKAHGQKCAPGHAGSR